MTHRLAHFWMAVERLRSGLRQRTVCIAGCKSPYLEGGAGPTLILIHGFGGDSYSFIRVAAHLRRRFRVLIPDLPGFGGATRDPAVRHDMHSQARHLTDFMDALGLKTAHIGGNSMGGFVASQLAIDYPTRVQSLWLLEALGCPAARESEMFREFVTTGRLALIIRTDADYDQLIGMVSAKKLLLPRSVRRMLADRAKQDADLHSAIAEELAEKVPTLTEQHAHTQVPTLLVWGALDRILSPSCIPEQQAVFPNHAVIVMEGIGHLPMLESPRTAALDYLSFFDSRVATVGGASRADSSSTN